MTLNTTADQMIQMSSLADSGTYFEDYETALIVASRRYPDLLWKRKEWTHRTETWVQFGTNYSWVRFEIVDRIECECGRAFKKRKGYNAHRGERGNCPKMNERSAR